jgi:hypothetical protein
VGMLYIACALFLNELFERQVLPIGAPIFSKGAVVEEKNVSA